MSKMADEFIICIYDDKEFKFKHLRHSKKNILLQPTPIWEINAYKFKHSFQLIGGNSVIDYLSQWTPFEWDTLYSFAPYTPKEKKRYYRI